MEVYFAFNSERKGLQSTYLLHKGFVTRIDMMREYAENLLIHYIEETHDKFPLVNKEELAKEIEDFENGKEEFGKRWSDTRLIKSNFCPGQYYPRIYRPIMTRTGFDLTDSLINSRRNRGPQLYENRKFNLFRPIDSEALNSNVNQIGLLMEELFKIFQSVHPVKANFTTFGHRIRNLFIISCTEVEAQLKGILTANIQEPSKKYNTEYYVKLLDILKLDQFKVRFTQFPKLGFFAPFLSWNNRKPTESLPWYNDYNAVKHDRENEFEKATLFNLINSISAIFILCIAQFGEENDYLNSIIGNKLVLESKPRWSIGECYFPPGKPYKWKVKKINL